VEQAEQKTMNKPSVISQLKAACPSSSFTYESVHTHATQLLARAMDYLVIAVPEHSMPQQLTDQSKAKTRMKVTMMSKGGDTNGNGSSNSGARTAKVAEPQSDFLVLNGEQLHKVQFLMRFGFSFGECEHAAVEGKHDVLATLGLLIRRAGYAVPAESAQKPAPLNEEEQEEREEGVEMEVVALEAILEDEFKPPEVSDTLDATIWRMRFNSAPRFELYAGTMMLL
jgi:hypothetical protein